ncbi:uncharacterized protein EV420DRAFT_1074956 [Desarmillaria tabescens]|uniref:F-box domain-containing protein n=1 Tax=Armillaria tabescens TaxID=1929756 RepID=A0AA39MQC0_ARMTA|nr:uncharacterized protein EV420DRAFT_1074956 [Desarmillaria tabescens]KAK0442727.1 hypothetical protein EV420DRAFT_1074956 [Desarmillaria tabescens]
MAGFPEGIDDSYSWPCTILCHKCSRCLPSMKDPKISSSGVFLKFRELYSPSELEILSISNLRSQIAEEIDAYDAEILRIQSISEKLNRDRDLLRSYADHYGALLAPVRRLPYDILLQIFEEACKQESDLYPSSVPFLLGLVCKRWRNVTITSPSLWSNIVVRLPSRRPFPASRWQSIHKVVKLHLLRSGCMPLALRFLSSRLVIIRDDGLDIVAETLVAHQFRFREIRGPLRAIARLPDGLLSSVGSLIMEGYMRESNRRYICDLPNIHTLTIRDGVPLSRIDLPQHVHTLNLEFRPGNVGAVIRNLSRMRSLRSLTVEAYGLCEVGDVGHFVRLPTLTSFTCRNMYLNTDTLCCFLASIDVPALTDLTIIGGAFHTQTIISLIQRSRPPLRKLTIITTSHATGVVEVVEFIELFRAMPDLASLTVHDFATSKTLSDSLLNELRFDHDHDPLFPKLEHLELAWVMPCVMNSSDAMINLIKSRHIGCSSYRGRATDVPLKSVALGWPLLFQDLALRRLEGSGLQVRKVGPIQEMTCMSKYE